MVVEMGGEGKWEWECDGDGRIDQRDEGVDGGEVVLDWVRAILVFLLGGGVKGGKDGIGW